MNFAKIKSVKLSLEDAVSIPGMQALLFFSL